MYLDPSEGKAGHCLETIYGAATSGALTVDPQTGETTLRFLAEVKDLTLRMARQMDQASVRTPLGGGYAEQIGRFNQELATAGPDSAQEALTRFSRELDQLMEAVTRSMASYRDADAGGARAITSAGTGR